MKYSVVIPALNEEKNIKGAIDCLLKQSVPKNDFEIIVVDNNSADNTAAAAREAGADFVCTELKAGTNFARQAGLEKAQGEIVAFLDADSLPPEDWLKKIGQDLADKKIAAVSGPYDYGFGGYKKILSFIFFHFVVPILPAALEFLFRKKSGVIFGGNFAVRQQTLAKIGGLPPLSFWGDDSAIAMLISRQVGPVLFDPGLIIKSSPRRFDEKGFFKVNLKYFSVFFKIFFSSKYGR